MEPKKAVRVF